MIKRPTFFALVLAAAMSAAVIAPVAVPTPAHAAAKTVSAKVGKPLQEAQKLAKQRKITAAIAKAKEAQAISGKTKYEEFVVNDFLAYLYTQRRDYRNAAHAYEAALNSGQAPASSVPQRIKTLAQLYYQVHDYNKAITFARRYQKQVHADAGMELMIAQAYYQQRNYKQTIVAAQEIVNRKEALNLILSSAYHINDSAAIKRTLFTLTSYYPNHETWNRLIKNVQSRGGLDDQMNLALQHMELNLGLFTTGDQYFNLGKLALALNIPGDSQHILELGFQKKLLGSAPGGRDQRLLKLAKDTVVKDKAGLDQRAEQAQASSEPKADIYLGLTYASYGQYDKAVAAIKAGLAKAGSDANSVDDAQIALGRVYHMQGKTAAARSAFRAVKGSDAAKDLARMWLIAMAQGH
jgi:tetratricopeptide (TPR) repeat protein